MTMNYLCPSQIIEIFSKNILNINRVFTKKVTLPPIFSSITSKNNLHRIDIKRLLLLTAILLTGCASAGFGNLGDIIASTPILVSKNVATNADEIFYCVESKLSNTGQQFQGSISPYPQR
jgi:hypothetical protein